MEVFPTCSVLVAVYNGADTIARCIESLLDQDYPPDRYQIIIVENGSTDDTAKIVKPYADQYPDRVKFLQSKAKGKQAALNLGITNSTADIIAMTDADCIAVPHWLAQLVQPYTDPQVGGVGGLITAYVHPDRTIYEQFSEDHNPLINYISGDHEFLPHLDGANCSYRRDLLNKVGNYNTRLVISDDVDVCWRVQLQTGAKIVYNPDAVIHHHHRSTRTGLARQYYHYGYGEIVLDALYKHEANYPRNLSFQLHRITGQILALARYTVSVLIRRIRYLRGRATAYEAALPRLLLLIEFSNIRGKVEALIASRLMTQPERLLKNESEPNQIDRFYQTQKM